MTIGELKKSLSRFPADMDDTQILIQYLDHDDNVERDLLSYIAYAQMGKTALSDNTVVLFLGTWKAVVKLMAEKKIKFDDGNGPMEIDP